LLVHSIITSHNHFADYWIVSFINIRIQKLKRLQKKTLTISNHKLNQYLHFVLLGVFVVLSIMKVERKWMYTWNSNSVNLKPTFQMKEPFLSGYSMNALNSGHIGMINLNHLKLTLNSLIQRSWFPQLILLVTCI
jgi:hypothetical protein